MPPPIIHPCLHLEVLPETFYVKQYSPAGEVPPDALSELNVTKARSGIFSVTRTADEISVVGEAHGDGGDWRCIKIAGPMEFELTGVIANFSTPLKDAKIPVFAISTWNTDYVLIPKGKMTEAISALGADGWQFTENLGCDGIVDAMGT
ncbi:ACT domain-containing protein [Melanogaster broomeanus]|nr:ACT domain-containing protein [Melanogaster broomeanus]